jgi:hypothetical protein
MLEKKRWAKSLDAADDVTLPWAAPARSPARLRCSQSMNQIGCSTVAELAVFSHIEKT